MILKILSYPRSILLTALYPAFLLFCSVTCIVQNLIFNRCDFDDAGVGFWGKGSCKMFGVKVEVIGAENIPKSGGVFLFNHTSFFDIFARAGYLQSVRFGAKIELFKIPFFGWAMRRVGILPIARRNREEVFRIYQEAKPRLLAGEKIALAP